MHAHNQGSPMTPERQRPWFRRACDVRTRPPGDRGSSGQRWRHPPVAATATNPYGFDRIGAFQAANCLYTGRKKPFTRAERRADLREQLASPSGGEISRRLFRRAVVWRLMATAQSNSSGGIKEDDMPKTSKRLGRGLASLITDLRHPQGPVSAHQDVADATVLPDDEHQALRHIEVDQIRSNPFQPRQNIPDAGIISLAESIRSSGMIQPISVRSVADHFEIIAGERRWRAAKVAGWARVPVIVREVSDQDMLEMALIENIQREDLNAIDRAQAYRQYCDRFGLSAEEVAAEAPEYGKFVEEQVSRLGRNHPMVKSQFFSETVDEERRMFPAERLAMMQGTHAPQLSRRKYGIYVEWSLKSGHD